MISTEKLSALIGAIYDCAVAPDGWEATLQSIRTELGFATAVLAVNPLPAGELTIFATSGIAPEWLGRMWGYGEETLELWGGPARISQFPLDEPIVQSQVTDRATWNDNPWITEWGYPQGLWDAVGFAFARDPTMIGNLTFGRHRTAGEVGDAEMTALRLIAPHVRRAIAISHLLEVKTLEALTFASALETLTAGVVLVDEKLGILFANDAAGAMLRARDPIRSQQGRLTLAYAVASQALETAVEVAARNEMDLGRRGIGIPLRRADGAPCLVHVMPLRVGQLRPGLARRATAAVFVAPAASPPRMPADALALLYDLTPAESRIFELIVDGQAPSDIAVVLGIAPSTVKTHLLRVFEKTGCNRQVELVKLAASMSLPI
jgi:DNA-binding CsgD family transcriptional regulator